ncbi:MAG TPA: nuclear transport factor 2 family protein [Bryobacteraceae bacterium]|nr:nuclear transport factor 2 family protein [Bryobacteraceae bacterium]
MKVLLLTFILALGAFAAEPGGELAPVLAAWKQAMLKGDAAALDKLYHKDLTYVHSSAKMENKAEAIAAATKSASKAIEYHDVTTRMLGSTAIVRGKFDLTNAQNVTSKLEILMVWTKSGAGWQLVARQATKLP